MKNFIFLIILFTSLTASSQAVFMINSPAQISGTHYDITYASWGNTPDPSLPGNSITGNLRVVSDGTPEDSLGCFPLINSAEIDGNIAVVYRGSCQFSDKAYQAQNAGAIAVIVINNVYGGPIGMAPGDLGWEIFIPVIMISKELGELIYEELHNSEINGFIGSEIGLFNNDVRLRSSDVVHIERTKTPSALVQDISEFSYTPKAWIKNIGNLDQPSVALSVEISLNGSVIFSQESTSASINVGDSALFETTIFSLPNISPNVYSINYEAIINGSTDENPMNNVYSSQFSIDGEQIASTTDFDTNGDIISTNYYSAFSSSSFGSCITFRDPNASRLAAQGLNFSLRADDDDVEGRYIWLTHGLINSDFTTTYLNDFEFEIPVGSSSGDNFYAPFESWNGQNFILLEDDITYFFCVNSYDNDIQFGYNLSRDLNANVNEFQDDFYVSSNHSLFLDLDGQFNFASFGSKYSAALSLKLTPAINLFDIDVTLNNVSCNGDCNGSAQVTIIDGNSANYTYEWLAEGQVIEGATNLTITGLCAGNYEVRVTNDPGITSTQEFTIQGPSALNVWVDIWPATCNELSNGQFTANVWGGTAPYSYAWSTGENTQFLEGLSAGFQAGLVVTDANGCQTNAGVQTMYASTVDFGLAFVANPTAGISPLTVIFDNQTPNLSSYNFQWDFGDGFIENNNASFVPHLYSFDGIWDVTLTATDAQGCIDQLVKPGYVFTTGGVSCTHTATIQQASPLAGCIEDNIVLTCNTSPTFTYQWLLNSIPVFGANDSSFSPTLSGNYTVRITENNCPVISTPVQVTIYPTPATPQITGSGFIDACTGGNMTLNATSGYASYNWSNGAQTQDIQVSSSGAYTVTVANVQGCSASSVPYIVNASFMDIPEVCIVGYDSITSGNLVVWENPDIEGIDSIYVYREGNVANQYFKIGAVAYEDLSVFSDIGANPAVQAYRYKLSLLDTCGTETALSELHKTIHLTINQGVGQTWNLIWSHYEGIEFGSYNIYRGTNQDDLTLLTTIASNLNSYTDLTPPAGLLYYQIEVVNEDGCDPTRSYSSSKSNIVNNNEPDLSSLEEQDIWSVSLYPNPANEYILLDFKGGVSVVSVEVVDIQGRILYSGNLEGQSASLDITNYQSGVYFVRVSQGDKKYDLRFVKL